MSSATSSASPVRVKAEAEWENDSSTAKIDNKLVNWRARWYAT